jgi:hypothetical protein
MSCEWMDKPAEPKLTQGDLMILIGLVTSEWASVRNDQNRVSYYETLRRLRQALIAEDRSPKP